MAGVPGVGDMDGAIRRLFGDGSASGVDEGELLRRFASDRDPLALEVLVARHGPMVLGVCRRVLGDRHGSEDAFQATFLVLARRAGSIRDPDRLGPWLHGVAHRVALRARSDLARRKARETTGAEDLAMENPHPDASSSERLELRAALDEEVRKLPEKFRDPIVLCYLDGLTHDEAASRLRCPVGTVRSRLSTGRAKLRDRLERRGVAVPSGVFAATLAAESASAAVSPLLLSSTVKAATAFAGGLAGATAAGMVSAGVASLAEGVVKTMIVSKLKLVAGATLAGLLTLGVGTVGARQFAGDGQKREKPADGALDVSATASKAPDARIKQLEKELQEVRVELDAAQARLASRTSQGVTKTSVATGGGGMGAGSAMGGGVFGGGALGGMGGMGGGMGGRGVSGMGGVGIGTGGPGIGVGGPKSIATLMSDDFVIVHKPKTDKVAAYSTETGEWTSYPIPKGMDVVPISSAGVVALMGQGDEVTQIATFVPSAGKWFPIDLKEPAKGPAVPVVVQNQAVYAIGRRVYAFSASALAWDVLELPEGAKPVQVVYNSRSSVEHGDHLYIFSVKTGKWTDFDAQAGRLAEPGAK